MRRALPVLLLLLIVGAGRAQGTWGVRATLDLPADASTGEFVANPFRYALERRDVLDARAFVEIGQIGVEGRIKSSTEVFLGAYYILGHLSLLGQVAESTVGLYAGKNFRADAWFVTLRGSILLYGTF